MRRTQQARSRRAIRRPVASRGKPRSAKRLSGKRRPRGRQRGGRRSAIARPGTSRPQVKQAARGHRVSAIVVGSRSPVSVARIRQLSRLTVLETIVVLDGKDPSLAAMIRAQTDAIVVFLPETLGPDEDRSLGALQARGDILLFVSGHDSVDLAVAGRLIAAVGQGADLALTDRSASLGTFRQWGEADRVRAFMNSALGCAWLGPNTLDQLPHAWSRVGMERVGADRLAVPALAQAAAITEGLRVKAVPIHAAAIRRGKEWHDPHQEGALRLGDHAEALVSVIQRQGSRLQWPDQARRRSETGGDRQ
ncbi:glycosyltransferase family A protein [Paenibacillus methanolicus]|uniref:Glycosyl transferase family 2 n=1 Tax=Paenibacillus methanolicus TaxID=582686 RepID=A0A5S5BRM5_9BACL|nr:glycosyltransferase family A protein [Paenibacillus methanolicus]TYP69841.1 glycosyl transferase family 2 [Paenibacillus methanolicus]